MTMIDMKADAKATLRGLTRGHETTTAMFTSASPSGECEENMLKLPHAKARGLAAHLGDTYCLRLSLWHDNERLSDQDVTVGALVALERREHGYLASFKTPDQIRVNGLSPEHTLLVTDDEARGMGPYLGKVFRCEIMQRVL